MFGFPERHSAWGRDGFLCGRPGMISPFNSPLLAVLQETKGFKRYPPFCAGFVIARFVFLFSFFCPPAPRHVLPEVLQQDLERKKLFLWRLCHMLSRPHFLDGTQLPERWSVEAHEDSVERSVRSLSVPLPGKCHLSILPGRLGYRGVSHIILIYLSIVSSYRLFQSCLQQLSFGFQVCLFVTMQVLLCSDHRSFQNDLFIIVL